MKKIHNIIVLILFITPSYQMGIIKGCVADTCRPENDSIVATENRPVRPFNSIKIRGAYSIDIIHSNRYIVEIVCDQNILPKISSDVKTQQLNILAKKQICTKNEIKIFISSPELEKINASGTNHISVTGFHNQQISINMDGAGDLKISGTTQNFYAKLSGLNDLFAKNLQSEKTLISIAGTSDAQVYASKTLEIEMSGIGHVSYFGNPKNINQHISGIGKITAAK